MTHPPAYEEYTDKPRPENHWDTPDGSWVGIWGYDWADQMAIEAIKVSDKFKHEIWQPDYRADKIYHKEIYPSVVHKLFPAQPLQVWHGLKRRTCIHSNEMATLVKSLPSTCILHMSHPIYYGINKKIIDNFHGKVVLTFHENICLPINHMMLFQKDPFKKVSYYLQHLAAKRYFKNIAHVTFMNDAHIASLRRYYSGAVTKLTMGIDSSKFRTLDKSVCKKKLNLSENKKILLTVSRISDVKQIDKIITVLGKIPVDFVFVVVGHGTERYENYIRKKAAFLGKSQKIRFEGYKNGVELVEYYNAADLFVHVSKEEGGPVVIMEAMACGLPAFCTDTGNTAEVLKENNAGIIVGTTNYQEWKQKLAEYLRGKPARALDIEIVKKHYDWRNIAKKLNEIYNGVSN